jgi:outer membrane protein OmpA-like peptidoglycan-associated protein
LVSTSCGGPSGDGCTPRQWSGRCALRSLVKVHEKAFPVPQVGYQAIYAPERNPSFPSYTPPEVVRQFDVLAAQEYALRAHLEQYPSVDCFVTPPAAGSCVHGELALNLPQFDPNRAAPVETVVQGCAQIDAASAQDRLPQLMGTTGKEFPEAFQFSENSSDLPAGAAELASRMAQEIASDPTLECVAVVGELSYGERLITAAERARNVLRLLLERGVDKSRLTTIVPTTPISGGAAETVANPAERRVRLRVLLRAQPQ